MTVDLACYMESIPPSENFAEFLQRCWIFLSVKSKQINKKTEDVVDRKGKTSSGSQMIDEMTFWEMGSSI